MGKPVEDPLAPQCGNCVFWDASERPDGAGECTGVPPTPCIVGARPAQFAGGRVQYNLELIRPVMAANARPCAHHKRFEAPILGSGSKFDS